MSCLGETSAFLHELLMKEMGDKIAVVYDTGGTSRSLSYKTLQMVANLIQYKLNAGTCGVGGFVGVRVDQCEVFPAILLGVLQAGMGFYCMDFETEYSEDLPTLQLLKITYVIVDQDFKFSKNATFEDLGTRSLGCNSTRNLYLLKVDHGRSTSECQQYLRFESSPLTYRPNEWAYAIKTSGTTGNRKLVLVSHQSIVTNVLDFAERFQLGSTDVIFGVSPATFDPHIVDVFMTLKCGGTILYVPKTIKLRPQEFLNLFTKHGVTVLQCTPSLFYRLDEEEARCLFLINGQLRVIAFGGEPCPQKEYLRKIITTERRRNLSIWNLYGTTECSCWAAANSVQLDSRQQIGILQTLIPDTFYKIVENDHTEAEIFLGTKQRRCIVLRCQDGKVEAPIEEDGIQFRRTGDTVDLEQLPFVAYKGRMDNRFKRQGHFVDLHDLEQRLASIPFVENAACFGDFGSIYAVIVFLNNFSFEEFEHHRRQLCSEIHTRVPIRSIPDHVTVLHPKDIPLTPNGKLDIKELKQLILEKQLKSFEGFPIHYDPGDVEFILSCAWELFAVTGSRGRPSPDSQFLEYGGDSLKVMQLVEYIFQELNLFGTYIQQLHSREIIRIITSSTYSSLVDYFRNILLPKLEYSVSVSAFTEPSTLKFSKYGQSRHTEWRANHPESPSTASKNVPEPKLEPEPYPNYNTYGCVDSTPVLILHPVLGHIVIATSNSGYGIGVALDTLESTGENTHLVWCKKFPDRLVASTAVSPDQMTLFIACCDCRLYAVQAENGDIIWNFFSGGLLLTTPVVVRLELVIITADSGWVFALTQKTGQVTWKLRLDGLISSISPHLSSACLFLATDKDIVRVDSAAGIVCPRYPLQTIYTHFASHTGRTLCLGSSSAGNKYIHVFTFEMDKMEQLWKVNTTEPINNPIFYSTSEETSTVGVFYVTKSGRTCVHDINDGRIHSEIELGTPIASTPTFIPPKGKWEQTRIVIISKDSDSENITKIFFIKLRSEVTGKINMTLESKDIVRLTLPNESTILTNLLYDKQHLIFGRRDDRVYFLNQSVWEI